MNDAHKTPAELVAESAGLRRNLDALMNNLPEGVLVVDLPDVRVRLVSRDALEMLGVTREEFVGVSGMDHFRYYQLLHPDGTPATWDQTPLARVLFAGAVIRSEQWLLQFRDGRRIPVLLHSRPIRDAHGVITGGVVSWQDISDRQRAENALRKAHDDLERRVAQRTAELERANANLAMFRRFAEASNQGFSMATLDGVLTYVNPALARMLGDDTPTQRLGQHLSVCYAEEANRYGQQVIEPAMLESGHWEGELSLLARDGRSIPTWHMGFLIPDERGQPLRMAVVITDITERKQAEAALRQSHDELRAIYDGMVDGMHILSLRTLLPLRANQALCRMMGYSEAELCQLAGPDVHPPEEFPRVQREFQAFLEGRGGGSCDVPLIRKDRSMIYADISGSRIDYNGEPCVVCFFHETTERRNAQEALRRERQSLWNMLQASDHERQVISYEIHDGLAQYLAAATMQFQAFDNLRAASPVEAEKSYQTALELVRQAHFEARRLISEVRPPVIDEIGLETAVSHLVHEQRRRGHQIEFHSDVQFDRLPAVLENALYRIVQEALTNACRHSGSERIAVRLTQEGSAIRLEIRDWGSGFDPATVEAGHFGLEGIRQRVRLLGGTLAIDSPPGEGTAVLVSVPLVELPAD